MPSPLDRSVSRHVALIATPAQLTTIGSRPRYALAFADDGTIQSITGADTLVTIPTTGTTASTNLVVEATGTASAATVLTLSHALSSGTPAAGIGTGMTYYAQVTGGPIALGSPRHGTSSAGSERTQRHARGPWTTPTRHAASGRRRWHRRALRRPWCPPSPCALLSPTRPS